MKQAQNQFFMSQRESAVKPLFRPIKISELQPVAEVYKGMLTKTGVQALFTAQDGTIDATWVTNFGNSITAVESIVPTRTVILLNKDIAKGIKDGSKNCVLYGKVLTYYLKKAFPNQPGLQQTFRVIEANEKMRRGETEGMLYEVNTLIEQVTDTTNNAALVAAGWPTSNLTDYQALRNSVKTLNLQQELAKKMVPENTDEATTIRNTCYGFVHTLVTLKDIVYYTNPLQKHEWALTTNLKQIRFALSGAKIVLGGPVPIGATANIDISQLDGKTFNSAKFEAVGSNMRFYGADNPAAPPMPPFLDVISSVPVTKNQAETIAALGMGGMRVLMNVQNYGLLPGHFKITFKGVKNA